MTFETVSLADISVPSDRLRQVKEDFASVYANFLRAGRSLPPIQVRRTPNGKTRFVLVSGAHRYRAHQIAGADQATVEIVKADKAQAREMEIEENLFRNELSALERIDAVANYRRIFEERFGKIVAGNPNLTKGSNLGQLDEMNLLGVVEDSQEGNFYARVSARLGLSRTSTKRLCTIARTLLPQLHDAIQGTPVENNQSAIERLAKMPADKQAAYAKLLGENGGDLDKAEAVLDPPAKPLTRDQRYYETIVDNWTRTNERVRRKFVEDYRPEIERLLAAMDGGGQ